MRKMKKKRSNTAIDENQEHTCKRLSRADSNSSPNILQDVHDKELIDDAKNDMKKGRGLSKLNLSSGHQKPKELERNEFGQPIGVNSVKYASFLGCMVKEFVPYTLDGWNDVDEEVKNRMWQCLKVNYNIEECEKKAIFQKLAKLWRDRKSKLQILVREADVGKVAARNLNLLKPEFMNQEQWELFVKRTLSPEFQEKSKRFRTIRVNQDNLHTMSRRGYARLASIMEKQSPADTPITRSQVWIEGHTKKNGQPVSQVAAEKIKKIEECPPESLTTTNIADDAISIIFGKESRGRVRGMGFGVTPSKIGTSVQNGAVKHLENIVYNLQQEMQEMRSMFLQNQRQQNEQEQVASGGICSDIGNSIRGGVHINGAKKIDNICNVSQQQTATQLPLKNLSRGDIIDNTKCKLLHWSVDGVVAEGRIASTDPKIKVHHVPLGGACWKVWIDRVFVDKLDLI